MKRNGHVNNEKRNSNICTENGLLPAPTIKEFEYGLGLRFAKFYSHEKPYSENIYIHYW